MTQASASGPTVTVLVCTYTALRWAELAAGIDAARSQLRAGDELLVVVDHNDALLERVRDELGVTAIPNAGARGLSGGRNTGVAAASGDVVVFLDDDACPAPGWVEAYRARFTDPAVVAVGGSIRPAWEGGAAPRWFPPEFGWVVGCDYIGLPGDGEPIRNPIGASMAVRRSALVSVGGFSELVGRVGTLPVGCEETDLAIRVRQADPGAVILRDTTAQVDHLVPVQRQKVSYFVSRCYHEGRSKAVLSGRVGAADGLSSERAYATRVLPRGMLAHLRSALRGDGYGAARAGLVPVGLAATGAGYLSVRLRGSSTLSEPAATTG
ncbi:MAG: glycosyltransferase [Frankiales bacterium]|nr:glycosyltransferase [Frankiales bacterium]